MDCTTKLDRAHGAFLHMLPAYGPVANGARLDAVPSVNTLHRLITLDAKGLVAVAESLAFPAQHYMPGANILIANHARTTVRRTEVLRLVLNARV